MEVVYYLLLQDRLAEALEFFEEVNVENLATRLQYDYFAAYLSLSQAEPEQAREIAAKHQQHPVDRWRKAFASVLTQVAVQRLGVER